MFALGFIARHLPRMRERRRVIIGAAPGVLDHWSVANQLAGEGRWADALHTLFAGVIAVLGRGRELDPHPAKTIGDYVRELSQSGSRRAAPFSRFASDYERAVYGTQHVSRETWESLASAARGLLRDTR